MIRQIKSKIKTLNRNLINLIKFKKYKMKLKKKIFNYLNQKIKIKKNKFRNQIYYNKIYHQNNYRKIILNMIIKKNLIIKKIIKI